MAKQEASIVGTLDRIIYMKPDTGFMIARFFDDQHHRPLTIKGTIFNVAEGARLQIKGTWENHKVYGRQLSVQEFMPVEPSSLQGIEKYLSSEIPGIGKKTASRIVKKFGKETFEIIDTNPEALLKIPKFNKKQLQAILDTREDQRHLREVMSFLHGLSLSQSYAHKIFQVYGLNSIPLIKANPYQLTDISGIGFQTADLVAKHVGFEQNSPERAQASILYSLKQLGSDGHTCYPEQQLIERVSKNMEIDQEVVEEALARLRGDRLVNAKPFAHQGVSSSTIAIAQPKLHKAEAKVAENLMRLLSQSSYTQFRDYEVLIQQQQNELGITLDEKQKQAVLAALENKVLIITGGPGTGKTTIIQLILSLFGKQLSKVALAAPTGKAAKRLSEATSKPASTIHRLLEFSREGIKRNRENPIECELLIIDEASMIDTFLMHVLLEAIDSHTRLVLVGDVDQLPSVGPGAILSDLIQSQLIPVARLETIFRQAAHSLITTNAHSIRKGEMPHIQTAKSETLLDFYFIPEQEPELVVQKIIKLVTNRIPERFGFDPKTEVQVLTPMHRGVTGSINLNQELQNAMNPSEQKVKGHHVEYRVGDKVIQQVNSYEKEVFNGDVGVIIDCRMKTGELLVEFDQGIITYKQDSVDELALAYAISVHKSQGSEYPAIILPFTTHHYLMLQRNLLYTAVTRGKKLVIVIGMEKAMRLAVENSEKALRHTLLPTELQEVHSLAL